MYEVVLESPDRIATADEGEALRRALFSALKGRAATVSQGGEPVWKIEVGSADPYRGYAVVRFLAQDIPQTWKHFYVDERDPLDEAAEWPPTTQSDKT